MNCNLLLRKKEIKVFQCMKAEMYKSKIYFLLGKNYLIIKDCQIWRNKNDFRFINRPRYINLSKKKIDLYKHNKKLTLGQYDTDKASTVFKKDNNHGFSMGKLLNINPSKNIKK